MSGPGTNGSRLPSGRPRDKKLIIRARDRSAIFGLIQKHVGSTSAIKPPPVLSTPSQSKDRSVIMSNKFPESCQPRDIL